MKHTIKNIVTFLLFAVVGVMSVKSIRKYEEKKKAELNVQSLPDVTFYSIGQKGVNLHEYSNEMPLILIYFHPMCEHCNYEAQEIRQNASAFANSQLVMITADDSIARVEDFCNRHNLSELVNIDVLFDKDKTFENIFKKAIVPSFYVYGSDRRLKKRFLGETKPEAIIKFIHSSD